MTKKGVLAALLGVVLALYPVLVYFGLQHYGPRWVAALLLAMVILRFVFSPAKMATSQQLIWMSSAALIALVGALISGSVISLKLYPVLISGALLILFTLSLLKPPTIIEQLARLQDPQLPESGVNYTRNVTKIWCVFFLVNGSVAVATIFLSDEIWAFYNGFLSYIAMGCLFAGEYWVRRKIIKKTKAQ